MKPRRNDIVPPMRSSGSISEKGSTTLGDSGDMPKVLTVASCAGTKRAGAAIAARCLDCVNRAAIETYKAAHLRIAIL